MNINQFLSYRSPVLCWRAVPSGIHLAADEALTSVPGSAPGFHREDEQLHVQGVPNVAPPLLQRGRFIRGWGNSENCGGPVWYIITNKWLARKIGRLMHVMCSYRMLPFCRSNYWSDVLNLKVPSVYIVYTIVYLQYCKETTAFKLSILKLPFFMIYSFVSSRHVIQRDHKGSLESAISQRMINVTILGWPQLVWLVKGSFRLVTLYLHDLYFISCIVSLLIG